MPTHTMENTTEVESISIYDKPKRGKGRPTTCTLSDEEKKQRAIEIAKRYYSINFEYVWLQKRIWLDKKYEQRKEVVLAKTIKFRKPIIFLAFCKNNIFLI